MDILTNIGAGVLWLVAIFGTLFIVLSIYEAAEDFWNTVAAILGSFAIVCFVLGVIGFGLYSLGSGMKWLLS